MIPPLRATAGAEREQPSPVHRVRLAALAAGHGLCRLTERYLPAFAVALGYGPVAVGALATLGLGVAAVAAERATRGAVEGEGEDGGEPAGVPAPAAAVLAAPLAAAGLLAWAGAPALDGLLGTPVSALGWLAVGVVLLRAWHVFGPTRTLWPTDTRAPPAASARSGAEDAARAKRRSRVALGALGVAVAAAVATAAVAGTGGVRAGVPLLATIGAAVALVCAVVSRTAAPLETSSTGDSIRRARDAAPKFPDRRRWAVVGDGLVRLATVGIAPFLILLLAVSEPIALSIGGRSLAPAAVFGLFVLAEAAGAIVGAVAAPALASRVDRRGLLAVGLAAVSLFPMALVAAPGSAAVVAALFVLFGCRTAVEPLRPTVGADARSAVVPGSRLPAGVRSAVRLAVVPAPLVAGLLYALEPLAAFTAATTVGLLGVRELGRAFGFRSRR